MKKVYIFILLLNIILGQNIFAQNVGIGTPSPNSSAILDISSSNKGMLVPRIALSSANNSMPVSSPADALLIYNTATAGAGADAVEPGFYYWNASANRWTAIGERSSITPGIGGWGDCSSNNISAYYPVTNNNAAVGDAYGYSVAMSGNYAIIGSPFNDGAAGANQGSASIYQYNGNNWVLMQEITDASGVMGDQFGYSVAMAGNYAIVGANLDDSGPFTDDGSASIYQYNGMSWVLMQKIIDASGGVSDNFGFSVSISGSYAIIGSPYDNGTAGPDQGSVSIYQYNGMNWGLMQKITDIGPAASDLYGYSVSISGNYAVVGASADDNGMSIDQGSINIYQYNGMSWTSVIKIIDATGASFDQFGNSVSISGNYLIVGAFNDAGPGGTSQGSASIYQYDGNSWVLMQKLTDPAGASGDNFGISVCISGNYAIIGAGLDAGPAGADQGSANIYVRVGLGWQKLQLVTDPGANAVDQFGRATAIDGSTLRFLNGAPQYGNGSGKVVFGKIN